MYLIEQDLLKFFIILLILRIIMLKRKIKRLYQNSEYTRIHLNRNILGKLKIFEMDIKKVIKAYLLYMIISINIIFK